MKCLVGESEDGCVNSLLRRYASRKNPCYYERAQLIFYTFKQIYMTNLSLQLLTTINKTYSQFTLFNTFIISLTMKSQTKISFAASLEKIQAIANQHYDKAMKHVKKFNIYQQKLKQIKDQKQTDPQCTFKPKLYKSHYNKIFPTKHQIYKVKKNEKMQKQNPNIVHKNIQNKRQSRLISWGQTKDQKNTAKAIGSYVKQINQITNRSVQMLSKSRTKEVSKLNRSLDNTQSSSTFDIPGTNTFFMRQARAKALKQQKSILFKDDSYSTVI